MIEPDMSSLEQPESSAGAEAQPQAASSEANPTASNNPEGSLPELDSLERFKWQGKEWKNSEFQKHWSDRESSYKNLQSEFTKVTQERKFVDALRFDLASVRENPALAEQFKKIYPEKFHGYLDLVLKQAQEQAGQKHPEQQAAQPQLDPKLLSRIDQIERMVTEEKVTALEAKLEAQDQKFSSKYPMADVEAVYARAQAEHSQGNKLTEEAWEKIWKADHEKHQKRYEAHYSKQVKEQKEAIGKAKDTAPGGGIPGQAPERVKLKNVAESLIASGQAH